jgi:nitroimidazol reductase NimA-like FMN-containing flavoprotein (pyridoxamine 5'-phosphate oxidase superfamily)
MSACANTNPATATPTHFATGAVNQVRRIAERGHYDKATVFDIVDRASIAHVGFIEDGRPVVIPMTCARWGDELLIHGARKSRIQQAVADMPVCITVTHLDALIYARSIFHSSMNYRSAVIHGIARVIEDEAEKLKALQAMSAHLMPGRWQEVRPPLPKELKATEVQRVEILFASAKIRDVGVLDDKSDYTPEQWDSTWAGIVPLAMGRGRPLTDSSVVGGLKPPPSVHINFESQER